jgi:hypothetical protein
MEKEYGRHAHATFYSPREGLQEAGGDDLKGQAKWIYLQILRKAARATKVFWR